MKAAKDKIITKGTTVYHKSAGGFVFFRKSLDTLLVAILQKKDGDYYMPKGHIQDGETIEQAAIREVIEGLGLNVIPRLITLAHIAKYSFENDGKVHNKVVYIYVFEVDEYVKLTPRTEENFKDAQWVSTNKARELLTYDKSSLQTAVDAYDSSFTV